MSHNIPSPLRENLQTRKNHPAIIENGQEYLWSDVANSVEACKGWLLANDVKAGDRIALIPSGHFAEIIFLLACCDSGVVFCGLNGRYPGARLETMADDILARTLTSDQINEATRFADAEKLSAEWNLNQPCSVIFTSGSTGQPKAILHTLGNHIYNALGSNQNIAMGAEDKWQLTLPMYHVSGIGIVFRTLLSGTAMVITDEPLSVDQIIRTKTTHLSLVSTQFKRLLSEPNCGEISHQLKALLLGGGPISQMDIDRGIESGLPVFVSYGLSEMASQVATTLPNQQADLQFGKVLPHREVKINDSGEILVKGATLFAGYIFRDKLDDARDASRWFHTRDCGELRGDQLRVTGRLDNQFISGGENIQPEMIERELMQIPGIEMAVVVPVLDEEFSQRPLAFLLTESPIEMTRFTQILSQVLPRYMLPVRYEQLPKEIMVGLKPDRLSLKKFAAQLPDKNLI